MTPDRNKTLKTRQFIATADDAGSRLDVFLSKKYPSFTRSSLTKLFDDMLVEVNREVEKASYKLHDGDVVSVDEALLKLKPPKIDLPVIYEDDNVVVVNKPAGILAHSKGALNLEGTVASFIAGKLTDKSLEGNRAGIVHRLDRPTSGVMITAKNSKALSHLQKQFSTRKTKKTYTAIVEGMPEPEEAVIDVPLARNPRRPQTFRADADGKSAQTRYKVLQVFEKGPKIYSLLELRPVTGRTHQIRVHAKYIGHPVVGDHVYGHEGKRLYLHASKLEVTLPGGERKVFEVSEPAYFEEFMNP